MLLIGFAAETTDVVGNAREKLRAKRLDMVVANDVSDPALGFGTEANRVHIITPDAEEALPVLDKRVIARELLDRVASRLTPQKER